MYIISRFLSSNFSFFFFCRFTYPLTWGKNGSFCRNEFQKIIFFGENSVIFQIKHEQQKYFILTKKGVSRNTDGDSISLGIFCSLNMSTLLHPLLQIYTRASDHTECQHIEGL